MLRFIVDKELESTRQELVHYLCTYALQQKITLPPYEEKPFALSAYALHSLLSKEVNNLTRKCAAATSTDKFHKECLTDNKLADKINIASDAATTAATSDNSNITNTYSNFAIGSMYCIRKWNEVYLDLFVANPYCRIRGTGTALMRELERAAMQNNCEHITLFTLEFQARGFYERCGFQVIAEQKQYAGKYLAIHMAKTLNAKNILPACEGDKQNKLSDILVRESDTNKTLNKLHDWIITSTEQKGIYDVPEYDKVEYALQAIIKDGNTCVGGAIFDTCWGNMTVKMFVINPLYQHKDYGKELVQELIKFGKAKRCKRVTILATDEWSKNLLLTDGFVLIGTQHNIPRPFERYYMEKML